jgi:Phosphatidylinositol transfer protein
VPLKLKKKLGIPIPIVAPVLGSPVESLFCISVVFTNGFLQNRFSITVETWHKDNDINIENVHELPPDLLAKREVVYLNIANDPIEEKEYSQETDPRIFTSQKTGRGPLRPNWVETCQPRMCCYKLVTIKFKVFGFEWKVENLIANVNYSYYDL